MSQQKDSAFGRLLATTAIGYGLYQYPLDRLYDPVLRGLWWFGLGLVALGFGKSLPQILAWGGRNFRRMRIFRPNTTKGSAGLMTEREVRKERLHRRKKGARFIGTVHNTALWLWTETHHLIVGPSGSSKSTAAIINILMGSPESALITDIKRELYLMTHAHRAKKFGHDVLVIDVKNPATSTKINPLDDIIGEVATSDPAALSRARGIVMQLLPDPKGGGGAN
ncbi:MAG: type IV secretory system conjugative DNA transfer family protein, partial [Sulfitobacter sp.]